MVNSAYFKSYCIYKGWLFLGKACDLCQSVTSMSSLPPTSKTHGSKTDGWFASFLHPQMIFMSITWIVDIDNTYRTISCVETHFRRRIKKSQTCQYYQQLYGNEYKSYLIIIESQQLKHEFIFRLNDDQDILLLYKKNKAIHVSPNSFRVIK